MGWEPTSSESHRLVRSPPPSSPLLSSEPASTTTLLPTSSSISSSLSIASHTSSLKDEIHEDQYTPPYLQDERGSLELQTQGSQATTSALLTTESSGLRRRTPAESSGTTAELQPEQHARDQSAEETEQLTFAIKENDKMARAGATRDRAGYLPLSSGFTPATGRGASFARSLFTKRKLPCVLFLFFSLVLAPLYMLGPRMLGDERMKKLGLDEYWRPADFQEWRWPGGGPPPDPGSKSPNKPRPPPPNSNSWPPKGIANPLNHIPLSSIPYLKESNFPAKYYMSPFGPQITTSSSSSQEGEKSPFAKYYPEGDPHLGIIPPRLLAMLEDVPTSSPPPRPPALRQPTIPETLWKPHQWDALHNGSTTTFADTARAAEQPAAVDFRQGTEYAGWKPPLADLSSEKVVKPLPRVQASSFDAPSKYSGKKNQPERDALARRRQTLIKNAFLRSWEGYKKHAWGHDELQPISNGSTDPFNGWGATIVDALDTLLVMELPEEYNYARQHVRDIDFTLISGERSAYGHADGRIPVFETAIRYLGGLISAYDLSGDTLMRDRAEELAQLIMPAFSTLSGVPVGRLTMGSSSVVSSGSVILSEATSLLLEFTRLWQVTGNRTYYDQVQRVTDWFDYNLTAKASGGKLGSLLPTSIAPEAGVLYGHVSFGGMADSYYEYLVKEHQLLGGRVEQYSRMYSNAIDDAKKYLFYPVTTVPNTPLLIVGVAHGASYSLKLEHLACFSGAMVGLGSRVIPGRDSDLNEARHLTEACYWTYNSTVTGIGPEDIVFYKEEETDRFDTYHGKNHGAGKSSSSSDIQQNARGFPQVGVRHSSGEYKNRPEAIESVFYMWRITGDEVWRERGWQMFASWVTCCMTQTGFSGIWDVNRFPTTMTNSMESFAFAETFKYYYLLFSPPDLISLDDYVFSTEAHPFLVPKGGKWTPPGGGPKKFYDAEKETAKLAAAAAATNKTGGSSEAAYMGGEGGRMGGMTHVQKAALLRMQQEAQELALSQKVARELQDIAMRQLAKAGLLLKRASGAASEKSTSQSAGAATATAATAAEDSQDEPLFEGDEEASKEKRASQTSYSVEDQVCYPGDEWEEQQREEWERLLKSTGDSVDENTEDLGVLPNIEDLSDSERLELERQVIDVSDAKVKAQLRGAIRAVLGMEEESALSESEKDAMIRRALEKYVVFAAEQQQKRLKEQEEKDKEKKAGATATQETEISELLSESDLEEAGAGDDASSPRPSEQDGKETQQEEKTRILPISKARPSTTDQPPLGRGFGGAFGGGRGRGWMAGPPG